MTPVDGRAAARTMLSFGTWRRGYCLEAVWTAYARNGAQDLTGESEPTAYDAWLHTNHDDRRTGTPYDDIPAGVPVWFGSKPGSRAGDVVISDGGGWCIATDIPGRPGTIGRMRIAARQAQIARPYLGWSTTILDYPIATHQEEKDDMGTIDPTEANYQTFAAFLQRALQYDVRPAGFGPKWELGQTLWERLNAIETAAKSGISFDPAELADAIATAIPDDLAQDVVDALATRLNRTAS